MNARENGQKLLNKLHVINFHLFFSHHILNVYNNKMNFAEKFLKHFAKFAN